MAQSVTKDDFKTVVLENEGVVLVDFWAPWCGPCQSLLPTLETLAEKIDAPNKIVKVNVDDEPELAAEYGVMSIPALKVFKGGKIVQEEVGVHSEEDLMGMITNNA